MADKYPWEDWDEEKRAKVREAIKRADGIKLYRSAGGIGVGAKYAGDSAALAQSGGLTPEQATTLARFRMHQEVTGGDPGWQGPLNIPNGPREPADTPEQIDARRDAYFAAAPADRARMLGEQKLSADRAREGRYDDLVQPKRVSEAEALTQSMKRKKKGG